MIQMIGSITAGAACDRGLVRETNEDRCFYRAFTYTGELGPERGMVAAVADGMGGHAAGEAASELAVQVFAAKFSGMAAGGMSRRPSPDWPGLLRETFGEANELVTEEAARWSGRAGMGTTLTGAVIVDDVMYFGHVGDSRAYIIRNGQIIRLTQDHTWVAKRVREGLMTPEEAETSDKRGQLIQAIGLKDALHPEIDAIALRPGDRILLCTDGITEMLTEEEIFATASTGSDLQKVAAKLVSSSNRAGGYDNSAAVLIECHTQTSPRSTDEIPRLINRAPRWAVASLAVVLTLIAADGVYLAARSHQKSATISVTATKPLPPPPAPSYNEPVGAGGGSTDTRMLDLSGKPVEVNTK